jgi:catechol 2,3-dioxygenase
MQLKVLDLDESIDFYTNVVGLIQTGREGDRAYFKAWDERDHNSLCCAAPAEAGMDFFGFKVADDATLAKLESRPEGVRRHHRAHPRRRPARDRRARALRDPVGSPDRALLAEDRRRQRRWATNPPPWCAAAEQGIAPIRMDHALLYGPDIEKVQALFVDVLGFYLVEHVLLEDGQTDLAIWLSCSTKAHDIAFVRNEEPGKLHHTAFLLESWEKVLRAADLMSMNQVSIDMGPTRHGVTRGTTIYAFDNSGNRFETFCGGYQSYPDWEPVTWTWDEVGPAVFYHDRQLNPAFLSVYT